MTQQQTTPRNDKMNRLFRAVCFIFVLTAIFSGNAFAGESLVGRDDLGASSIDKTIKQQDR